MRACVQPEGLRTDIEHLPKSAADATRMQASGLRPVCKGQVRVIEQRCCELLRPIAGRPHRGTCAVEERGDGSRHVALGQTCDDIDVGHARSWRAAPVAGQRQDQHVGAAAGDAIEVMLMRAVEQHVAGYQIVQAAVTGFQVTARQYDGGEGMGMAMACELFAMWMTQAASLRGTHALAAQRLRGAHVKSVQDMLRVGLV